MDKYKKYYGIVIFVVLVLLGIFGSYILVAPTLEEANETESQVQTEQKTLDRLKTDKRNVENKIQKIKDSINSSQKKIYSPVESELENDSLFFTLYTDIIEMVQNNNVKIKDINYNYNPPQDMFVTNGKGAYFVCDINLDLVSNFINLGKLIENIYQYPYYIKMNEIEILPYPKDKKVLLTKLSLRLYSRMEPVEDSIMKESPLLKDAKTALPQ